MKKILVMMSIGVMFTLVACSGSSNNGTEKQNTQQSDQQFYYTCSMHPEIHTDKPGKCPKCGMELVKKEGTWKEPASSK